MPRTSVSVSHKLSTYLTTRKRHMKDTKKPTSATQAAIAFVAAKQAYESAAKAKKVAEQDFIEACAKEGLESIVTKTDDVSRKIYIRRTVRTKVVLEKLKKLVKPNVLKKLVVEEIDQKKVASAVEVGILAQGVVDQATEVTQVVSVMIAELEVEGSK